MGTPYAETTAALTAIKALTPDEVLEARIGRELEARRHPIPEWLRVLDRARQDAFVVPEQLEDLAIKMGTLIDDQDQSLTRIAPATARTVAA